VHDYAATSLSLKAHPLHFIRPQLDQLQIRSAVSLETAGNKEQVKVAGLICGRQRPETAKGICFITIEDETGTVNLVVFKNLFDQYRKEIIQSRLIMAEGELQREGEVIHVIVKRCHDFSRLLQRLTASKKEIDLKPLSHWDETTSPFLNSKVNNEMVQGKIFGKGRNFR
jgi:error-prone DNA polymerase